MGNSTFLWTSESSVVDDDNWAEGFPIPGTFQSPFNFFIPTFIVEKVFLSLFPLLLLPTRLKHLFGPPTILKSIPLIIVRYKTPNSNYHDF